MRINNFLYVCVILLSSCSLPNERYCKNVNPFIGTASHGHTYPGATTPFGTVQLSPDTRTEGWDASSGYHYSDSTIIGFSHTHLSGTGCSDLADILFRPVSGENLWSPMTFSHEYEKASPGYYSVRLNNESILAEMTATTHCGIHRYTFQKNAVEKLIIDLKHSLDNERIDCSQIFQSKKNEIRGMRTTNGWVDGQSIYFVAKFSKKIEQVDFYNEKLIINPMDTVNGNNLKAVVLFDLADNSPLVCKVGISSIGYDNALDNLVKETDNFSFNDIRFKSESLWENKLSVIQVTSSDKSKLRTFYTALYHTFIVPNELNDANGEYPRHNGKIDQLPSGKKEYSTLSIWDTFRTWSPLMTLVDTTVISNVIQSMLRIYDDTGELPIWPLSNGETRCMIGYHSVSIITDAYMKGIRGFDLEKALQAMKRSADINEKGAEYFNKLGYIPSDLSGESVSCSLEYCYDNWCIAEFARAIGHLDDYELYIKRSMNYKNLFNNSIKFFCPKLSNGEWISSLDPSKLYSDFTEATPWQYRFSVPHDVKGLVNLFGGNDSFISALDDIFTATPTVDPDLPDISGTIGQYVQGNEPSHGIAFLYNYVGQSWKAQKWVREILNVMYNDQPDGLCGNEDCGQMSAWYVMASLGLYPECPGSNEFILSSPLFEKSVIQLSNGKKLIITANNPIENIYIKNVYFNGKEINSTFINYDQLVQGGELKFILSKEPDKKRDTKLNKPYSFSKE